MSAERIDRFRSMVAAAPANHLARFGLANALLDAGRLEEAASEYRRCLEAQPDWMAVHISLGACLIRLGRHDEARESLAAGRSHALAQGHSSPLAEIDALLAQIPGGA